MDHQQIQKIVTAKRQQRLPRQPISTAQSQPEHKPQVILKVRAVDAPEQTELESEIWQQKPEVAASPVDQQVELVSQMPLQESGHLESLAEVERGGSLFGSGWEYGQLLKELR